MKGIIIYKGKYGATRQYAQWLSETMNLPAVQPDEKNELVAASDVLILGSSVYIGKLQLKEWLSKNLDSIKDKKIYLFVVCGTPSDDINKLESYLKSSVPMPLIDKYNVYYLPGRLNYNGLSRMDKFLLKMGAWLSGGETKKKMLTDYDNVKRENLRELLNDLKLILPSSSEKTYQQAIL